LEEGGVYIDYYINWHENGGGDCLIKTQNSAKFNKWRIGFDTCPALLCKKEMFKKHWI
jgi:hypothetical protein